MGQLAPIGAWSTVEIAKALLGAWPAGATVTITGDNSTILIEAWEEADLDATEAIMRQAWDMANKARLYRAALTIMDSEPSAGQ